MDRAVVLYHPPSIQYSSVISMGAGRTGSPSDARAFVRVHCLCALWPSFLSRVLPVAGDTRFKLIQPLFGLSFSSTMGVGTPIMALWLE